MSKQLCTEDLLAGWPGEILKIENMNKKEKETFDEGSWVVEVESSLEGQMRQAKFSDYLIHTVPKPLLKNKVEEFYIPQVISLGPYHFPQKDAEDDVVKLLKSEVARKMHHKIIWKGGLKSVMEKSMEKEMQEKIKESYASKEVRLSNQVCAWMMVRDACFVLEVLERFGEDEGKEEGVSVFIDSILNKERHHPLLTEIVKDMLKMENQLPHWVLKKVRFEIEGSNDDMWFESALKSLSPIKVAEGKNREYTKDSHILHLLHDYILDRQVPDPSNVQSEIITPCYQFVNILCKIKELIMHTTRTENVVCKIKEFIMHTSRTENMVCRIKEFVMHTTISRSTCGKWVFVLLLFPVFVILFILGIIFVILNYIFKKGIFDTLYTLTHCLSPIEDQGIEEHVPSIEELRRGGMKFKKVKSGISHIKFEKRNSTLYLPEFKVDDRSEVVLRNLIALEICSEEKEKPITRYAILMNDLVDSPRDVGILRLEDIITGKLGKDEDIANLWNSMVTPTEIPSYKSIDEAAQAINRHHKKWQKGLAFLRHRRLWGDFLGLLLEFIRTYGSRPWLFFSALIVLTILVLTSVQVFCVFKSCQLK